MQKPLFGRLGFVDVPAFSEQDLPLLMIFPLLHRLLTSVTPHGFDMLTRTQAYIVCALSCRGELTMSELANLVGTSKEQATRAVAPMVDSGLAERFVSPANRKHVHIRLTQTGKDRVRSFLGALTARLTDRLTAEEFKALRAAMLESAALLKKCE